MPMSVSEASAVNILLRYMTEGLAEYRTVEDVVSAAGVLARGANRRLMAGLNEEIAETLLRHKLEGCPEQPGVEHCSGCGRRLQHAGQVRSAAGNQ